MDKNPKNKNLIAKIASTSATNVKTKQKENNDDIDPYVFETDSINETNNTSDSKIDDKNSESENESVGSSKSFGSTELLAEVKKKVKRKRVSKGWQAGIIKPKNKKRKMDRKSDSALSNDESGEIVKKIDIPDPNCFTDKNYCFNKNLTSYDCRLCAYSGVDIVYHYKKDHPHSEIPLSRMSPDIANQAIKEAEKIDFQAICKISSKKYICRFCSKEFGRKKPVLELFFWHVVSNHTGEYKQLCSECLNVTRCPFRLDIPPPPKDNKGQLLGYVCEKCNYTQVSLENLKTHVIIRHNDEQTAVYTINLSVTAKSIMNNYLTEVEDIHNINTDNQLPRVLRSSRSNQSMEESSDVKSDSTEDSYRNLEKRSTKFLQKEKVSEIEKVIKPSKFQSKITFENDNTDEIFNFDHNESSTIKIEPEFNETQDDSHFDNLQFESSIVSSISEKIDNSTNISNDIFNYPHFKIKYSESGSKEYICCINGKDLHYRTTLLISFKKHVQLKHSENWDGYCFICKVIVTPQGVHLFKDCLQHFLDQHIDNFPVLEEISEQVLSQNEPESEVSNSENATTKTYINVRPLSELISKSSISQSAEETASTLPVIESVISLGTGIEQPRPSPTYPKTDTVEVVKQYRHEEAQAEIMSRKHRVVLEAMMTQVKLVQVFKCAGRFCSFTTDSAEDALLHASTHTRVGGEDSLKCVYCDFDSCSNAIDLITHVFKNHGCCQYVCGMCFYRAAASQLVNAHIKRVHENATVSILHTALQTAPIKEDSILTRESAVPYYLCCASSGSDAACKFRTYTPGKFCEHLMTKHVSATEHSCFMCSATLSTPADLIRHLKTHGLKLYQCTWCVFGADNETELLAHASANHPDKQPKAFLRIITNKEGTSEFRVLPLAHLNKSDVPAVEVKSSSFKENPVREAERSIELEKLIGHTTHMIESMTATVETEATERESTCMDADKKTNDSPLLENITLFEEKLTQRVTTPIPLSQTPPENQLTPIIKTETIEMTPEKPQNDSIVYCLDSDEEEAIQNVIDVPNDRSLLNTETNIQPQPKLLPLTKLFLCAKCNTTVNCGANFKKHITSCYSLVSDPIPCAHCSIKVNKRNIVTHYSKIHAEVTRYVCPKCPNKFTTLAQVREHERNFHSINSNIPNADKATVATNVKPNKQGRKRPLVNKEKPTEPPEKVKRFGPHDVNLLPINPILDDYVFCSLCEFSTKVRLNMVRHLQLHAEQQIVPQTAPVNPVPHLETNEKHFDKMLNLASSSIVSRTPEKNKVDSNTTITLMISPEAVSRYPKYVPERHRHTCGAKGCSYISVDESMFKCHWETLHSGTSDYRCVHCPPHQQLDTSKPLTAVRIIAHLKMHDTALYACSLCSYYHYKRQIVENHLSDIHKSGQVMVVREEGITIPVNTSQAQISAPTMDLKPWLCGLCKFKSLLRPEVVDHCAKVHNSKMQYKCAYCAFRTSNSENITKHQNKSHSDKKEEIFYYYYREGSVPENPDGIPLWQRQSHKCDVTEPNIKSEVPSDVSSTHKVSLPLSKPLTTEVDLNLVKKEVIETPEETIEDLCKAFGEFCEPNGLKYKCPLCKNIVEDNIDAMQSHLYEEVKYRKWGCSICSYKAFHKAGLSDHMQIEHRQNKEPIALQTDIRVETWVTKLLEYQTELIQKNKENLAKQKEEILRSAPGLSRPKSSPKPIAEESPIIINQSSSNNNPSNKLTMSELERLFGPLGVSVNMSFCCPKCHSTFKDADVMKNHLESELNKIRWFCNSCPVSFQTYHEAQFHCRSVHPGQSARPMEATRCPTTRMAWVEAVIRVQKLSMNYVPLPQKSSGVDIQPTEADTEIPENSLLVVRYEERIPTPEEQMARKTPLPNPDSDDDKLVIDEPTESRRQRNCPHCDYSSVNSRVLRNHILRHYNLKPFQCAYCGITGSKVVLEQHQKFVHYNQAINLLSTQIPTEPLSEYLQNQSVNNALDTTKLICLVCRNAFTEAETKTHSHDKTLTTFGKKGEVVVKCSICDTLHKDVNAYFNHHKSFHGSMSVNYVFSKLITTSNESKSLLYACSSCEQKFCHLKDLKVHSDSTHGSNLKYTIVSNLESLPNDEIINLVEEENVGMKRNNKGVLDLPPNKKVAKKSTTKLPFNKPFARKSTTKLPFDVRNEPEEFSYYGTRSSTEGLEGVTTKMSFCNTMVPFTLKKLNEIININPVVNVEKLKEF